MQMFSEPYALIRVDISSSSLLDWSSLIEQAHCHIKNQFKLLWELSYDSLELDNCLHDIKLSSSRLALEAFLEQVFPCFQDQTEGFLLYKGSYSFFKKHIGSSLEVLCTFDLVLPREVERWVVIEKRGESLLERLEQFASLEIGSMVNLLFEGEWSTTPFLRMNNGKIVCSSLPSTVGICLPRAPSSQDLLNRISTYLEAAIRGQNSHLRCIQERFLNEQWEILDKLLLFDEAPQLLRALEGFQAAGGLIERVY